MSDDVQQMEMTLIIRRVYTSYYQDKLDSIKDACEQAGISKATLYNYPKELREKIQAEVLGEVIEFERERAESQRRKIIETEAQIVEKGLPLVLEAMDVAANVMRTSRSDFNKLAAVDRIADLLRNKLMPDRAKIIVGSDDEGDKPAALPPAEPVRWLPSPDAVGPAADLRLASEVKTEAKFEDGTTVQQTVRRPPVVDG